jgi:hypothetical protein
MDKVLATCDAATVKKSIVAFCGYNYFAEGFELAEQAERLKILSAAEAKHIKETIVSWHRDLSRHFYDAPRPLFESIRRFLARRHWGQPERIRILASPIAAVPDEQAEAIT